MTSAFFDLDVIRNAYLKINFTDKRGAEIIMDQESVHTRM